MKALFVLLVLPLTQCILVEWYTLDGRRADPCVNIQKLDADVGRLDCADNTRLPPPATTYLLPSKDSPATRRLGDDVQLTFTGRNLQTGFFRLAKPQRDSNNQGQESCNAIDTGIASLVATANDKRTQITFNVASYAKLVPMSDLPRYLCYSTTEAGPYQWTGIRIGTVWNCDDNSDQAANKCATYVTTISADAYPDPKWQRIEMARTKCCSSATNQGQTTIRPGQCINPNAEKCCGATALSQNQKCCSTTAESSAWIDGVCPCVRESAATDCPTEESCCLASKYADLAAPGNNIYFEKDNGECYNWKSHRCCDTGKRYDPGSQQCCTINGLQSINTPCPCSSDAHCQGGQSGLKLTDQKCCFQTAPTPLELINNNQANTCSRFNNFPSGQGETSTQRCIGTCFDSRYQICCNGATCNLEYDACCNSTCCNQFTGACRQGFRPGTPGVPYNWNSYREVFDVCTKIEQLNHVNVFWVFIMPTALLIAVILSLAISLVFANRVEHKARRGLEKLLLIAALITILTAIPTFFAPVYKYGVVIIFSGFFTIIAVAARKIPVYAATAVILFVVIFYTWDPFHGNDYLNLSSDRVVNGRPDPASAGLLHSIQKMHSDPESCALFYDYFRLDPQNRDIARVDNPNIVTFGYCSRGWITNLLYFSGFCMIGVFTQFILIVIALLVRGGFLREQAEAAYAAAYQSAFGHH